MQVRAKTLRRQRDTPLPLPAELSAAIAPALETAPARAEAPSASAAHPLATAAHEVSTFFQRELRALLQAQVDAYAAARRECGLGADERGDPALERVCALRAPSRAQMDAFIDAALRQYRRKATEPSTPLGAIAAQVRCATLLQLAAVHLACSACAHSCWLLCCAAL